MPLDKQPTAVGVKRRACVNCTTGKAKCSPYSSSECERCHRLGKECTYLNVISKRKSPGGNLRMQTLEKKVDGLVHLLVSRPQNDDSIDPITQTGSKATAQNVAEFPYPYGPLGTETISTSSSPQQSSEGTEAANTSDIIDRGLISIEVAQRLLDRYRFKATQHFPFVVLSDHVDLSSIRHETPFLFLSIMTSMMVDNCSLQRCLSEELRLQTHRRMLVNGEKTLDLLQGLLVHVSWYHYMFHPPKQQVTLFTQLCITLAQELGLEKSPQKTTCRRRFAFDGRGPDVPHPKSPAQLRALLGTYYMASSFAIKFRKRSTMPYTKSIRRACELLATLKEFQTDEMLIYLIRITELSQRVHETFSFDELENVDIRGEVITNITVQSFMQNLENLQSAIPGSLKDNITLDLELTFLGSFISEVALHEVFWELSRDTLQLPSQRACISSTIRCNMLWTSIQHCKLFLHKLISYPNQEAFLLPFYTFSRICYVVIWLANLADLRLHATNQVNGKDGNSTVMQGIHTMLDSVLSEREGELPDLTKQLLIKLKAMAAEIKTRAGEPDAMSIFALMLRPVISGYDRRIRDTQKPTPSQSLTAPSMPTTIEEGSLEFAPLSSYIRPADDVDFYGTMNDLFPPNSAYELNAFEDMVWDKMMNDFVLPL